MKICILCLFTLLLLVSCSEGGLDGMGPSADEKSITATEVVSPTDARLKCRSFRPNYVLSTKRNYRLEVLESSSDLINHIYLVQGGSSAFLATDDDTSAIVSLPPTRPGRELAFEIRVHDPEGNDTGDVWQSGPGSRNADGAVHAIVERCSGNQYIVRFEDLPSGAWGASDEPNYVDAVFRLF